MCSEYQAVLLVVPQKDNLVMDSTTLSDTPAILLWFTAANVSLCELKTACVGEIPELAEMWRQRGNKTRGILKLKGPLFPFKAQCDEKVNRCQSAVNI